MKVLQTAVRMASRTGTARMSNQGVVPANPRYQRTRELQSQMTRDDGKLVWQKRGARDSIPYNFTMLATVVGLGVTLTTLVTMYFPRKTE